MKLRFGVYKGNILQYYIVFEERYGRKTVYLQYLDGAIRLPKGKIEYILNLLKTCMLYGKIEIKYLGKEE